MEKSTPIRGIQKEILIPLAGLTLSGCTVTGKWMKITDFYGCKEKGKTAGMQLQAG